VHNFNSAKETVIFPTASLHTYLSYNVFMVGCCSRAASEWVSMVASQAPWCPGATKRETTMGMGQGQDLVYSSKSSLFEECIIVFQVLVYK
jgi:hypothetical protein